MKVDPDILESLTDSRTLLGYAKCGEAGAGWYEVARSQVLAASAVLDIAPQRMADVLALFSPRVAVVRNIRNAVEYLRTGTIPGDVPHNVRVQLAHWEDTGVIRGPKCAAFARAIMGDPEAIVLDTWMGVAFGIDSKRFEAKYIRGECEDRIRMVSAMWGRPPAEVQAAIWSFIVKRAGRTIPAYLIEPEL